MIVDTTRCHSICCYVLSVCHFAVCRLKQRKCLQLVRMAPDYVARLHVVALSGELNPQGQSLDIVELAAVYGTRYLLHWINADNYSTGNSNH